MQTQSYRGRVPGIRHEAASEGERSCVQTHGSVTTTSLWRVSGRSQGFLDGEQVGELVGVHVRVDAVFLVQQRLLRRDACIGNQLQSGS